jgi:Zn-finger nucleic acid-binding protein
MFIGSKFCGHCGAGTVEADAQEKKDLGDCPRCKIGLSKLEIGQTTLSECTKCDGMWANVETFENICADREKQSAVLGFIGQKPALAEGRPKISYVPCPDCGQLMNRSNFARSSGVIIDICKPHGVWFDAEELPKIIEFIRKGGMEIARQKERIELEDERDCLRDERRRQALQDQRFGVGNVLENEESSAIRSLVRKLFD